MRRYLYLLLFILLTAIGSLHGYSQDLTATTGKTASRTFDSVQLQAWKEQAIFQYDKNRHPPMTLVDKLIRWIQDLWRSIMETRAGALSFWAILLVLSIALILFIVSRYRGNTSGIWSRSDVSGTTVSDWEEDIHGVDFEEQIAKTLARKDYRLAIRLRYLLLLQKLDTQQHIHWRPGKTNHDYIQEIYRLSPEVAYPLFRQVSRAFEFAWYGDHPATEEDYEQVLHLSDQLQAQTFTPVKTVAHEGI